MLGFVTGCHDTAVSQSQVARVWVRVQNLVSLPKLQSVPMGKGFDAGMSNSQVFNPPSIHLPFLSHFRLSHHTLEQSIFAVTFDSHTLGLHPCYRVTTYTQDSHEPWTLPPCMTMCSKPHLPR